MFLFCFGSHPAVISAHAWLCGQGSLALGSQYHLIDVLEIELRPYPSVLCFLPMENRAGKLTLERSEGSRTIRMSTSGLSSSLFSPQIRKKYLFYSLKPKNNLEVDNRTSDNIRKVLSF